MRPRAAFKALAGARKRPDTPCCCLRFYGRSVSRWCRPMAGRCVMRSCIIASFRWVALLGSPVPCPWGRTSGRGFGVHHLARRFQQSLRLSFVVERGASSPVGLLHRCLVASTSEVRVNLATPLWACPLSVADVIAPACHEGRKRWRRALSLPADAVVTGLGLACPCVGRATAEWEDVLPNPPCGPPVERRSSGGLATPAPLPLRL